MGTASRYCAVRRARERHSRCALSHYIRGPYLRVYSYEYNVIMDLPDLNVTIRSLNTRIYLHWI